MNRWHWHKWSKWSMVVDAYGGKTQWRYCEVCRKVKHRKIPMANQTTAVQINEVLKRME